jgi:hypothetical protein
MINDNTLKYLDDLGIGANINKLESYIIDYKQAQNLCDLYEYEYDYIQLCKILKEARLTSRAFSDDIRLIAEETDKYDRLFSSYCNEEPYVFYGMNNYRMSMINDIINSSPTQDISILAMPNVKGLNIRCSYIEGYIHRVNLVGDKKFTNITKLVKDMLPGYIDKFAKSELVECRGKITIYNNNPLDMEYCNVECSTMHMLRLGINTDSLKIIFNDIVADDMSGITNQWDKIEYLRELGFSVPHHGLIRDISRSEVEEAITEFVKYFENIKAETGIIYEYNGYEFRDNNNMETNNSSRVIYKDKEVNYKDVFESKIKSNMIITDYNDMIVNIIPVKCNDNCTITEVRVNDVTLLDRYGFDIGNKIRFRVVNNKAILV